MPEASKFASVIGITMLKLLTDSFANIKTLITIFIFNLSFNFNESGSLRQMHDQWQKEARVPVTETQQ